jgi:formate dehydrogenase iron-sulfur subunit
MKARALLIDITQCVGCNSCQAACKEHNRLPDKVENRLSATAYTALQEYDGVYVRRMCQHCQEPTCASVCPVGALSRTAGGPVVYDETKCIGCRYCIQACPFSVPRYEWSSNNPRVRKCRLCADRVAGGLPTACAEACPTGATKFGDRDELLAEAYARLRAEPRKYVQRVYGVTEVGGTSVFYITSVPFEKLGFKTQVETTPLPALTANALDKVPGVAAVGASLLYGIYWITRRRAEVAEIEGRISDEERRPGNGNGDGNGKR